jgi:hypothetical protein
MSEMSVLINDLTIYGLRRIHAVQMGEKVERGGLIEQFVPNEARELLTTCEYQDNLGFWHLWLMWNAREVVAVAPEIGNQKAVLWWVGKGGRLRDGADMAACLYQLKVKEIPTVCYVRKIPKGMEEGEVFEVEGMGKPIRMTLLKLIFVPEKMVMVA